VKLYMDLSAKSLQELVSSEGKTHYTVTSYNATMADLIKVKTPSPEDEQNNQSVPIVTNAKARVVRIWNWKKCRGT
jgi:hypothetical protein